MKYMPPEKTRFYEEQDVNMLHESANAMVPLMDEAVAAGSWPNGVEETFAAEQVGLKTLVNLQMEREADEIESTYGRELIQTMVAEPYGDYDEDEWSAWGKDHSRTDMSGEERLRIFYDARARIELANLASQILVGETIQNQSKDEQMVLSDEMGDLISVIADTESAIVAKYGYTTRSFEIAFNRYTA